ncbi:MAG: cyclic nucleotide-binding domain-containing protein [Candidatus Binatia bacterium]
MPVLESVGEHQPVFYHAKGDKPRLVELPVPEKLDYFTPLPLFEDILEQTFEKRPIVTEDGKKQIRDLLVQDALIEQAEFYEVPAGTAIFQEGSFGEHLFLILRGTVRTSTHIALDNEKQAAVELEELHVGDFFGEMSALSMNAHLLTAETVTPVFLLLVPQFIVQELDATQERFRKLIRQTYVRRAVQILLRRIPMLRFSDGAEIDGLIPKVTLQTFEAGEIIFEEGEQANTLYVVHQGFVKVSKRDQGKQRILSYLVEGDCFGETGVLAGAPRSASATAMSKTEALVVLGEDFRNLVNTNLQAVEEARGVANLRRLDADMAQDVTFVGVRLEFQAEVMPNLDILAIDETICIRCDNCEKACAAAHEDGISRLIRKGTVFQETLLPTACRFCQDPVCLLCKSGGIKRDKDGDIYFTESCIGCSGCAQRCPYGNIIMVDTEALEQSVQPTLSQYLLHDVLKSKGGPPPPDKRPRLKKIPVKCDLDKDHLFPACVQNCPTQAIKRYRADELDLIIAGHEKKRSQ